MKKILTALALTAVIASPAFARTVRHAPVDANAQYVTVRPQGTVLNSTTTVRDGAGNVIGADPDINVRASLFQNQTTGAGGQ